MEQIDWNKLWINWESKQKSFEDLCMFLCCRELWIAKIESYQNQPGIETEPFEVNGKKYGFQSKFFDEKYGWEQAKESVLGKENTTTTSKEIKIRYPNNVFEKYKLSKLFIYSNKDKTLGKWGKQSVTGVLFENLAKEYWAEIEYITDKDFLLKLSQPSNLDLAQLYFWIGDEFGFIQNSVNTKLLTLIQSSEYLELPIIESDKKKVVNLSRKVLSESKKVFLILGNPWSGKSILIHKLLQLFWWLDKQTKAEMNEVIVKNEAIPILINLKNCAIDSLENIIRGRKNDSMVSGKKLWFIYLFDGLDELSEEKADIILSQIYELHNKIDTIKIILSCRSGNINRLKAKTYFAEIIEYKIADLSEDHINKYFLNQGLETKKQKLRDLKKSTNLVPHVTDILLVKLLWDTIEELSEKSTIINLFDKKLNLLLDTPEHRKNIESLNILNNKKQEIINLNQHIAFEFQKKFQFRFSQKDLQELILRKFDRLDYDSINRILNYTADLFFEDWYLDTENSETSFIYQHRRYQEYFLTQKLKTEFEKDPQIIRKLKIISNHEYLEGMFLPYMRGEYEKEGNLSWLVELNLMNSYLWNSDNFWADIPYYRDSQFFISSLAIQDVRIFNELTEDENIQIKNKISIDFESLKKQFEIWNKDRDDYSSTQYLKSVFENGISSLIEAIVLLWKSWKQEMVNEFRWQLEDTINLYKAYKFIENLKENDRLDDPFWRQFENWIYYCIVIRSELIDQVFKNRVREYYKSFREIRSYDGYDYKEDGKEKLVKSFFRVCLKYKSEDLITLTDSFDEYEFINFLEVLKTIDYLPFFVKSGAIQVKIRNFIENYAWPINKTNLVILFFKRYLSIEISAEGKEAANTKFEQLRDRRSIDWNMYGVHIDFAWVSYVLDKFSFEQFLKKQERYTFRYYNAWGLYSALFRDYILLLKSEKTIEAIVRDYIRYIAFYIEGVYNQKYLQKDISVLWAYIFSVSNKSEQELFNLKEILLKMENNIIHFHFFLTLNRLSPDLFRQAINTNDLTLLEQELTSWEDDFPSYVDRCFHMSMLFSEIDKEKAMFYFTKAILDWILRHGWHKDTIVSYLLTDAFEIIWKDNSISSEKKKIYAEAVFNLTLKVTHITDGDHTWRGPYLLIRIVSDGNIRLAEKFREELIRDRGENNVNNMVIKDILFAKIKLGTDILSLEEYMSQFSINYGDGGKPMGDFYEQKFVVYLQIAKSDLYTEEEKQEAFEKAYNQVEEIQNQELEYYLRDDNFRDEKKLFQELCLKYNKVFILEFDKKNENNEGFQDNIKNISEEEFIWEVQTCITKRQIIGKYKKLHSYHNGIVLKSSESWKILIQKTFEIDKNIKIFLDYLQKNNFPHMNYWTANSKYYHLALAEWIKNLDTKKEVLEYLYKNSGHGGFVNIMKSYEAIWDKDMCLKLFERYLHFCKLIVN